MMDAVVRRGRGGGRAERFIPSKAGYDWDWDYKCCTFQEEAGVSSTISPYKMAIAEALKMPPTRLYFIFNGKPPIPVQPFPCPTASELSSKPAKPRVRHIPRAPHRTLDAITIFDGDCLNLLDWSSTDVISIALGNTVYLWNGHPKELVTVDDEDGPILSVTWAPDGTHIGVGLFNSRPDLWDSVSDMQLMTVNDKLGIGSMNWLINSVFTTGGIDSCIVDNDVRVGDRVVQTYQGHRKDVCALKWSPSGMQLANGGSDNVIYIWDRRQSSRWLHKIKQHTSAVRALAWCHFQSNLLASGGDQCIKLWNTHTGASLNSVDTGSEVCALLWNKNERELLSSHGSPDNQLILWKYLSMVRMAELTGHESRVLYLASSPTGCTVASAAGDEQLMLWHVFGTPSKSKAPPEPFPNFPRIR